MSCCLSIIFFLLGLPMISGFIKCSFHFWEIHFWLISLIISFVVFSLPLTSFTVCHPIRNYQSYINYILVVLFGVCSLGTLSSFFVSIIVAFLLLCKYAFSSSSFSTTIWLAGISIFGWYALSCYLYIGSNKIFIFGFHNMPSRIIMNSISFLLQLLFIGCLYQYLRVMMSHKVKL